MSAIKKNETRTRLNRILPEVVVIKRTIVPAKETLFPGKLKKANEILGKTQFLHGL